MANQSKKKQKKISERVSAVYLMIIGVCNAVYVLRSEEIISCVAMAKQSAALYCAAIIRWKSLGAFDLFKWVVLLLLYGVAYAGLMDVATRPTTETEKQKDQVPYMDLLIITCAVQVSSVAYEPLWYLLLLV
jgi:hypothetical protein